MAQINHLVDTSELKTTLWKRTAKDDGSKVNFYYNEQVDSFTLLIVSPKIKKIVHYIDEHVALLYDPETKEIVGVRIESFQKGFLPKYAQLERVWQLSAIDEQVRDFGDLIIAFNKYQEKGPQVAEEISKITHHLLEPKGLHLEPVHA